MRRLGQSFIALAIVVGLLLSPVGLVFAQANPFTGKPGEPPTQAEQEAATHEPGLFTIIGRKILRIQNEMNRALSRQMRAIKEGGSAVALLVGMAMSFLYGVVHVAGPGHGKLVIISYFLGREAHLARGFILGAQIAATHVIAAIVLVWLADLVLRETLGGAPGEIAAVRMLSYAAITLIGVHMAFQALRRWTAIDSHGHSHGHDHGCALHGGHDAVRGETARQGILSFAVGLVPCTGATLIMLYALANDILLAGMLMVVAIGVGMAMAMAGIGIGAIVTRRTAMSRVSAAPNGRFRLGTLFQLTGGLVITGLGGFLLATTWLA